MSVLRWERDDTHFTVDGGMVLRIDDDRSQDDAYVAQYWYDGGRSEWDWITTGTGPEGETRTEDEARRACEMAVLHGQVQP